MINSCPSCKFV